MRTYVRYGARLVIVQKVVMPATGVVSFTVLGDDLAPVEAAERYLAHLSGIERSPNTVRAYAHGLKLWLEFLAPRQVDWDAAGVEDVSGFVSWLRCPDQNVIVLDANAGQRSAATVNRHLAAVFGFYDFHARSGVELAASLVAWRRVSRGSYKPFLHHVTKGRPIPTRPIKLKVAKRIPCTLTDEELRAILADCERLRDRFLLVLLMETGMRVGQALGSATRRFLEPESRGRNRAPRRQRQRCPGQVLESFGDPSLHRSRASLQRLHAHRIRHARLRLRVRQSVRRAAGPPAALPRRRAPRLPDQKAHRHHLHASHAASHPCHRADPQGRRHRGGLKAAHPLVGGDHEPGLRPSRGRGPSRPARCDRDMGWGAGHTVSAISPQRLPDHNSFLSKLFAAVRPEFRGDLIRPDADDPVPVSYTHLRAHE